MANAREEVYVWPTWLPRLLIGDASCEWSAWFKAHYRYEKLQDRDWTADRARHTDLLNSKRSELRDKGYRVLVEGQTEFRLKGKTLTLHGRPDLVAVSPEEVLVVEVKTGKPYPSHKAQLMVYMWGISLALRGSPRQISAAMGTLKGRSIDGMLAYEGAEQRVPATALDAQFSERITQLIRRIGGSQPAVKAPSSLECARCTIPQSECPERCLDQALEAETDEF